MCPSNQMQRQMAKINARVLAAWHHPTMYNRRRRMHFSDTIESEWRRTKLFRLVFPDKYRIKNTMLRKLRNPNETKRTYDDETNAPAPKPTIITGCTQITRAKLPRRASSVLVNISIILHCGAAAPPQWCAHFSAKVCVCLFFAVALLCVCVCRCVVAQNC